MHFEPGGKLQAPGTNEINNRVTTSATARLSTSTPVLARLQKGGAAFTRTTTYGKGILHTKSCAQSGIIHLIDAMYLAFVISPGPCPVRKYRIRTVASRDGVGNDLLPFLLQDLLTRVSSRGRRARGVCVCVCMCVCLWCAAGSGAAPWWRRAKG